MEATQAPNFSMLQPPPARCLHPEAPLERPGGILGFLRPNGRAFWPPRLLQETLDTQSLRPRWDPKILGTPGHPHPSSEGQNPQPQACPPCCRRRLGLPGIPQAPPVQRRPRKQAHPQRACERGDPGFEGVTLRFLIQPDSSLRIIPSYSLASSSRPQGPPPEPPRSPPTPPGGSDALGPRRCASCRTQRTPLWRDAEDGTPLCNACGIRYKKYGTRCSSCWLVPRKNLQPKRFCGRCGLPLGTPHDGDPRWKSPAWGPRATLS